MRTDWVRQAVRRSTGVVPQAVTCVAFVTGLSSPPFQEAAASAPLVPGVAQGQGDDACRFVTDEAMSTAFGRAMKGARLTNVCDYRGPGTDRVVVKVATGPEGTILKHAKSAAGMAGAGVQKVVTAVGEATAPAAARGTSQPGDGTAAVLALADDIFAAARARDARAFAGFFAEDPHFAYVINTRRLGSRAEVERTFASMLARQASFDPQWGERTAHLLTPSVGLLTGAFATRARRVDGDAWQVSGVVTFVAVSTSAGWRVVQWHTSE